MKFEVGFPNQEDADLIRTWRNDPESLAMSFSYQTPQTLEDFFPAYLQNYFSVPELPPLFGVVNGERVGVLRFDPTALENVQNPFEISLLVAPEKRNRGYGTALLLEVDPFLKRQGVGGILAQVMAPNQASLKAFTRAGYQVVEEGEVIRLEKIFSYAKSKVFIIAEAGSNWYVDGETGGIERGKQLIEVAKESGADAVKFQTFQAKQIYVPNPGSSDYLADHGIKKDIQELFEVIEIKEEMILIFAEECKKMGIEFMSSVFSPRDFVLIDPLVKRHKIASYEISYQKLISSVAHSKKPLILSTGASNVGDIDWAVREFRKEGGKELTLLQCTAHYPASSETLNLKCIPWLKSRYQVSAGLSDHSLDPLTAPLAAIALGATCIEKHFTLDRTLQGPDHRFAIEPLELKKMVSSIREVELMLGSSYKEIQGTEKELYFFCRRAIQALRDIQPGEILKEGVNIAVLRPGKRTSGIHPKYLMEVEGKKANCKIPQGEGMQFTFLEKENG